MIYEHKIINTFCLSINRDKDSQGLTVDEYSEKQLNSLSLEGWEIVSALTEFKFLLKRPVLS